MSSFASYDSAIKVRVSGFGSALERHECTHLSLRRGQPHSRGSRSVRARRWSGALSHGTTTAESTILASLCRERRETGRRRGSILCREQQAGVRSSLFVARFDRDVRNAGEEQCKEEGNEEQNAESRESKVQEIDGSKGTW